MREYEEIPLEQLEVKHCFLGHESKYRVHSSECVCGCGPLALNWQMWLYTNANVSLTVFEGVLLGYHSALFCFFLTP